MAITYRGSLSRRKEKFSAEYLKNERRFLNNYKKDLITAEYTDKEIKDSLKNMKARWREREKINPSDWKKNNRSKKFRR